MHPPKLRSEQQGAEAKGQKRGKYGSYRHEDEGLFFRRIDVPVGW